MPKGEELHSLLEKSNSILTYGQLKEKIDKKVSSTKLTCPLKCKEYKN